MKNKKIFLILVTLLAILMSATSCTKLYDKLASSYAPDNLEIITPSSTSNTSTSSKDDDPVVDDNPAKPNWSAPDFTVLDQNGNTVKLSDFAGKPIVINFWATWCTYCVKEMPDFQTAYEKYPDVQFIMVNVTDGQYDTVDSAKEFIAGKGYNFPIFFDTQSSAVNAYEVNGYPQTFFIDANGNLVAQASGTLSLSSLEKGIAMIRGAD